MDIAGAGAVLLAAGRSPGGLATARSRATPHVPTFLRPSELPFELTANPKYLFLTPRQREALSTLQYGLFSAKSLTLLVGEAGTGKTTLIRAALESERCRHVRCVYLNNPVLDADDFVRTLALKFDLGAEAAASKSLLLERLEVVLRERRARGEITALVVDEAQSLSIDAARGDPAAREHRNADRRSCCRWSWRVSRSWASGSKSRSCGS